MPVPVPVVTFMGVSVVGKPITGPVVDVPVAVLVALMVVVPMAVTVNVAIGRAVIGRDKGGPALQTAGA